ncbi:cutinase [Mycolicibacterium sp. (ex Dasyatis americana)]|nr:cutinase [Mycolicibacterium sp. (ex Dasyatis americana)]
MSAAVITALTTVVAPIAVAPSMIGAANAATCPPAEVVFARGRMEPPGPGQVGASFVNALRTLRGPNIALYPVKYPADTQVDVGANDMSRHVQWMMRNCPRTRLILGGYSLGAAATDLVLSMPIRAFTFTSPLPAGAERHVAAVALFGNGANWAAPITLLNPAYRNRTIDLCHSDDPICNPSSPYNWRAGWQDHLAPGYIRSGMVAQAARFVSARL